MANEIVLRPSYWASVSGGKDSLYMLYLLLQHPERYKLNGVVHFELEIDYPFIKDVIDYMESECKKHGIMFVRIKPDKSWYEYLDMYGFPSTMARWCNGSYKMSAKRKMQKFLKTRGEYLVSYIGYCFDEVSRYEKHFSKNVEIYPLVDFEVNEDSILEWAKTQPIFNDFYKFNRRCGCMYCPLASKMNLAYLLKYYPNNYKYMMEQVKKRELQMSAVLGRKFSCFSSNGKYDGEYTDNIVRTKYLPKIEEMIRKEGEQK